MRGRRIVGAALMLSATAAAVLGSQVAAADRPATMPAGEAGWSETLNGLRVRLTAPAGATCREGAPLPLVVEVQNNSDQPIPNRSLWTTVRFLAHDGGGKWLGVPAMGPELGQWATRPGDLGPGEVATLSLAFQNLRFNRPLEAGESIALRASAPTQQQRHGQLPLEVNSPPLTIRIEAAPRPLAAADVAGKWQSDLACKVGVGLLGSQTVRVDAAGNATLVQNTQRNGVRVEGRHVVALPPERLARLAADLRKAEVWRLADVKSGPPVPDGGSVRLALVARSGGSVVGEFAGPGTDEPPAARAVRQVIEELIRDVEAQAARPDR